MLSDAEEVLTINIKITSYESVKTPNEMVAMIGFEGTAKGKYFNGDILPTGVDTQKGDSAIRTLSARYMIKGKDFKGNPCKIFIENNAEIGKPYTSPTIVTDSPALDFLNHAKLWGKIDNVNGMLVIRIYK